MVAKLSGKPEKEYELLQYVIGVDIAIFAMMINGLDGPCYILGLILFVIGLLTLVGYGPKDNQVRWVTAATCFTSSVICFNSAAIIGFLSSWLVHPFFNCG